jgi:methionine synthase I (cobalamin-dependent)
MADGTRTNLTLLDGGVGHLIKQWGVVIPGLPYDQQFLAGVLALKAAPETVMRAHAAYIDCGCDVITTNNFVATQFSLDKVSKGSERAQYCQVHTPPHSCEVLPAVAT